MAGLSRLLRLKWHQAQVCSMSGSKVMAVLFQAICIQTCLVLLDVISELSTTKEENGQYLRIQTFLVLLVHETICYICLKLI